VRTRLIGLLICVTLLSASSGCDPKASDPDRDATVEAISLAVRSTATAEALNATRPQEAVETARAEATGVSQLIQETQAALDGISASGQAATQAAAAPIQAELTSYGIDPSQGRLGWIHPPVKLEVSGYKQYGYSNQFIETTAADLVFSADITWNTQYGSSGCGFVLRSDGKKNAWNQYLVIATRGASGHVLFVTMANGQVVAGRDIYAYGKDKNFKWENDTTNRLTIMGQGNLFTIYTNGVKIGEVDPTGPLPEPVLPQPPVKPADLTDPALLDRYQEQQKQYEAVKAQILGEYLARRNEAQTANKKFDRGFVAMAVLSESGHTTCQFDNAWLWLLN
jgi:hypothetical protein